VQVHHRVLLKDYLDFHLSCYHYIVRHEDDVPRAEIEIDCIEAWDAAIADWLSDTEEAFRTVKHRSLHLDLFRDSVFELIDMYTPTTDPNQYLVYLRTLISEITSRNETTTQLQIRHQWQRQPQACREARQVRDALRGEKWNELERTTQEANVYEMFAKWGHAQQAISSSNGAGDDSCPMKYSHAAQELTMAGFVSACSETLRLLKVCDANGRAVTNGPRILLINVFRDLDIDGNGTLSCEDLRAALVDDAPSVWAAKKTSQSRFAKSTSAVKRRLKGSMIVAVALSKGV
jgi:hypothetical protein